MATVISDQTGAVVEVVPVVATAAMASINTLASEFPAGAAVLIEQAMSVAAQQIQARGVSDPEEIKAAMMSARESVKLALRTQMRDQQSQG